jgi:hypothetical protein
VGKTRGFDPPPRIHLGSPRENPTLLTRQDWRGPRAGWSADSLGYWEVEVIRPGSYDVRLSFDAASTGRVARLSLRSEQREVKVRPGETGCRFEAVPLTPGPGRLEASITGEGSAVGVWSVEASRRD